MVVVGGGGGGGGGGGSGGGGGGGGSSMKTPMSAAVQPELASNDVTSVDDTKSV